ncbi:DEAD/DEAH box helicase [Apiospora saccharicola]|uniref:DEAD/DEAH box helicase n=1 Tax=Apiospora saccharicola TaxID=335842 RepID=A0ABR1WHQ0_9PEZI
MASRQGVYHHTTVQNLADQHKTYNTKTVTGTKRSFSTADVHGSNSQGLVDRTAFQRASSVSAATPKLRASAIDAAHPGLSQEISEYSQRQAIASTPTSYVDRALQLSHPRYALPGSLIANFASLGIKDIYPWQKQCLMGPGILTGENNLVYTAPTGGGKSLVADVLMLKRVLEDPSAKALLILPYVALVQEKVRWLRNAVQGIQRQNTEEASEKEPGRWRKRADEGTIRVVGFFGGGKVRATWADFDIGVCTFEKANTLINTAIDDCSIGKLRAVVLDELHMIDDDHRGYLLELMATKLLSLEQNVQIVGMSATLSNIDILARWLDAHTYQTFYRPVPIEEHLVYESKIYAASATGSLLKAVSQLAPNVLPTQSPSEHLRLIRPSGHKEFKDPVLNAVIALANETVRSGYGALVFCSSRPGCESDARLIARVLPDLYEIDPTISEQRSDLLGELRSLPTGLDPSLAETVPFGVAFHPAGINLPARRVILHNARMGRDLVGPSMLRQMRGRAGRKGKDEIGETYLCCRKADLEEVIGLMHAELPQISSGLMTDKHRIQRALLESVAIRLATGRDSLEDFVSRTLLNQTESPSIVQGHVEAGLKDLSKMGFIEFDDSGNHQATQLGKAVVASSLEPEDGAFVHRELQRALRAFVMDGELHILYTFTPVQDFSITVNWKVFRDELERLDESGLRVLTFLGLKPTMINRMAQGAKMKVSTPEEKELARVYTRFYMALQLRDLCNEVPIHVVARKFDVPRGTVQTLAQTCQGFSAGMIKFCQLMGWGVMAAVLDHVADRLKAGAKDDLLALAQITFVKSRTARVFYENGYKSVASIANADPKELVPVLMQAQPTKLRLKEKDEQKYEEKLLAKANVISDSANRIWQLEMQQEIDE